MTPATLPLEGGRWVPFVQSLTFKGVDLSGASYAMHIRLYPDAPGSPLVNLAVVGSSNAQGIYPVYADTNTVNAHIAEGRLSAVPDGMVGSDSLALTVIQIRVNETTMEALPYPAERGKDNSLAYDLHVTPSGRDKQVWLRGPFTVEAGVVQ